MTPRMLRPLVAVPFLFSFAALLGGCSSDDAASRAAQRQLYEEKRATHVLVTISASDRVRVDDERFSPKELPQVLVDKGRVHPGRPVLLLVQPDTKPEAITFVKKNAATAKLGKVEVMVAE